MIKSIEIMMNTVPYVEDPELSGSTVLKVEREQGIFYNSGSTVLGTPPTDSEFTFDPVAARVYFKNEPGPDREKVRVTFKY